MTTHLISLWMLSLLMVRRTYHGFFSGHDQWGRCYIAVSLVLTLKFCSLRAMSIRRW
jgi:hypothetical protein